LERELRAAIGTEDIQPFFQPLVDLKTKKVVGFEALARWTHKELGNIPPDRFIPIAEDSGLIHELSDQLLRQACRAARTWPETITLSFNISPVQLTDRTLGLRVLSILDETGLLPTRLEVEITESALVRDIEAAKEVLGSLHDAGIRIALDDFVTGYSSLYHLRNFKIDTIKIDRSFVDRMGVERESAEIVSALVGLGRGLGMTVIAEGIEGNAQDAELQAQGCQQGQGFLFGQAVSAKATEAFFAERVEGVASAAWA
jgi:EAL domain-containing protein (putative c-di-GMP-specific phosphodiesterase class I)